MKSLHHFVLLLLCTDTECAAMMKQKSSATGWYQKNAHATAGRHVLDVSLALANFMQGSSSSEPPPTWPPL